MRELGFWGLNGTHNLDYKNTNKERWIIRILIKKGGARLLIVVHHLSIGINLVESVESGKSNILTLTCIGLLHLYRVSKSSCNHMALCVFLAMHLWLRSNNFKIVWSHEIFYIISWFSFALYKLIAMMQICTKWYASTWVKTKILNK